LERKYGRAGSTPKLSQKQGDGGSQGRKRPSTDSSGRSLPSTTSKKQGAVEAGKSGALKGALGDSLGIPHSDKKSAGFSKESTTSKGALGGESDIPHSDKKFAGSSEDIPVVEGSSKAGGKGGPERKKRLKKTAVKKHRKPSFPQKPPRGADAIADPGGIHPYFLLLFL
jgi:hypothetical protein